MDEYEEEPMDENEEERMDENEEKQITLEKRESKKKFIQMLFKRKTISLDDTDLGIDLNNYIIGFVKEINKNNDEVAVIFGGNSWHYNLESNLESKTSVMNEFQKAAVLSGAFDIYINVRDRAKREKVTKKIISLLQVVKNTNDKHHDGKVFVNIEEPMGKQNYGVVFDRNNITRDIQHNGEGNSDVYYLSGSNKKGEKELLMHIEISSFDMKCNLYKRYFIKDNYYLSPFGLLFYLGILFSSKSFTERKSDKGFEIDVIRFEMFKKYLLTNAIHDAGQADIQYLIIHLAFVLIPTIYSNKILQNFYMSRTFLPLAEKFNSIVRYEKEEISFNKFQDKLGSDLVLDSICGGNTSDCKYPVSFRKILQYLITSINKYLTKCEIVGGDAFAFYDESVEFISDIDAKLYYNKTRATYYIFCITQILIMLRYFIFKNKYFNFTKKYSISLGNVPIEFRIDTTNQNFKCAVRYLPLRLFPVNLVSLDIKFNCSVIANPSSSFGKLAYKTYLKYSPLDISFITNDGNIQTNITSSTSSRVSGYVPLRPKQQTDPNLNLISDSSNYYFTPVKSPEWLIDDITKTHSDPIKKAQREAAGKLKKDESRLKVLTELQQKKEDPSFDSDRFELTMRQKKEQIHLVETLEEEFLKDLQEMFKYYFESCAKVLDIATNKTTTPVMVNNLQRELTNKTVDNKYKNFIDKYVKIQKNNIWEFVSPSDIFKKTKIFLNFKTKKPLISQQMITTTTNNIDTDISRMKEQDEEQDENESEEGQEFDADISPMEEQDEEHDENESEEGQEFDTDISPMEEQDEEHDENESEEGQELEKQRFEQQKLTNPQKLELLMKTPGKKLQLSMKTQDRIDRIDRKNLRREQAYKPYGNPYGGKSNKNTKKILKYKKTLTRKTRITRNKKQNKHSKNKTKKNRK